MRPLVATAVKRAGGLPLRSRVLAALLSVIFVSEAVVALSFYNQQKQHAITEELVSVAQRMHEIGDFQFAVAQLALQSARAGTQEIGKVRSMLPPFETLELDGSPAEHLAARALAPDFALLARTREQFDRLPDSSPQRAMDKRLMIKDVRALTAATAQVHNYADGSVRAAQASAHARESDAFGTLLAGSAISVAAAVGLALLLAGTITRPVASLAAGARQLAAGRLDFRLPAGPHDEIGVVSAEFNRMAAQLQGASATLEQRVRTRTEQLAQANRQLDLHRAAQERLAQERRMLLGRVIGAQEEERRRIARELHDETGQSLTAISLGIEGVTQQLGTGPRDGVGQRLRSLAGVAADALAELERVVLDLRPAQLDRLGLVATLRWYVARVRSQSGVAATLTVHGQSRRLAAEIETTLFRVVQEALTNVIRHARATRAEVVLSFGGDVLQVEVTDDGIGFDAQQLAGAPSSVGLIGMRERVQLVGGSLLLQSRSGEGTHLKVAMPFGGKPT